MPILMRDVHGFTLNVEGTILASQNFKKWPLNPDDSKRFAEMFSFIDCSDITFESRSKTGVIDGQGYMWWLREFLGLNLKTHRPKMLQLTNITNLEISGILFKNSPSFFI